jgi:hypothetical protein
MPTASKSGNKAARRVPDLDRFHSRALGLAKLHTEFMRRCGYLRPPTTVFTWSDDLLHWKAIYAARVPAFCAHPSLTPRYHPLLPANVTRHATPLTFCPL